MWTIPEDLAQALSLLDIKQLKAEFEVEEHAYILQNQENLLAELVKVQRIEVLKSQALALQKILPQDQNLSYEEFESLHQRLERLYYSCQTLREFIQLYQVEDLPLMVSLHLNTGNKLDNMLSQMHSLHQSLYQADILQAIAPGTRVFQHNKQHLQVGFCFKNKTALLIFSKLVFLSRKVLAKRQQLTEQIDVTRTMHIDTRNKKEILAEQAQEMADYLEKIAQSLYNEFNLQHKPQETIDHIKESIRHLSWLINCDMQIVTNSDMPAEINQFFNQQLKKT